MVSQSFSFVWDLKREYFIQAKDKFNMFPKAFSVSDTGLPMTHAGPSTVKK